MPTAPGIVAPFTAEVMSWHASGTPIIGLHTNERGYDGSAGCPNSNGQGNITAACSRRNLTVLPADPPARGASPDDTMVYVAATAVPEQVLAQDPALRSITENLRRLHTNVLLEHVGQTDCSLSNYAVLHGMPHYYNVEVEMSDVDGQAGIIGDLVETLRKRGVLAGPGATER